MAKDSKNLTFHPEKINFNWSYAQDLIGRRSQKSIDMHDPGPLA
ncbi:21397_t:CDS:2 [Gigaspora rosea]|nr:21397_t:CDS:2 [Gigaspora rosea]